MMNQFKTGFITEERAFHLLSLLAAIPFSIWISAHPQNPDSAEMIMTALNGGVLHPPGFPLQSWIGRFIFYFDPMQKTISLSAASFMFHMINVGLVYSISRRLGAAPFYSFAGAVFYSTYPLMMGLALQPEKYTLVQTAMFSVIYFSLCSLGAGNNKLNILLLNISAALSFSQHPVSAVAVPFWLAGNIHNLVKRRINPRFLILNILMLLAIIFIMYSSLPLLRADNPAWPDWGNLKTPGDVFDHLARKDIGGLNLNLGTLSTDFFTGLDLLAGDFYENFNLLLLFFLAGMVSLRSSDWKAFIAVSSSAALALILFGNIKNFNSDNTVGLMERYLVFLYVFVFIILGTGIEYLSSLIPNRRTARIIISLMVFVLLGARLYSGIPFFKAMKNDLIMVYRKNLSASLREEDLFISGNDFDTFYGVPWKGNVRFPIVNLFSCPWYVENIPAAVDPKIRVYLSEMRIVPYNNFDFFLRFMRDKNLRIASSANTILKYQNREIIRRGLLFVINDKHDEKFNLEFALGLCGDLEAAVINVPEKGHYFMRDILKRFSLVYSDIEKNMNLGDGIRSSAGRVSALLKPGIDKESWAEACGRFKQEVLIRQ